MNKKNCKSCGKLMINMRADAVYCSDACRKRKVREKEKDSDVITVQAETVQAEVVPPATNQTQEIIETESLKNHLTFEIQICEKGVNQLLFLQESVKKEVIQQKGELGLLRKNLPEPIGDLILNLKIFKENLEKKIRLNADQKMGLKTSELSEIVLNQLLKNLDIQKRYKQYLADFPKKQANDVQKLVVSINSKILQIKDFDEQIKRLDKEKSKLNQKLNLVLDSYLSVWRHNNKKAQANPISNATEKPPTKPVPVDVQNLTFEPLKFTGYALVLDQLDRTSAFIFLKGQPGAGKTHFSFLLLQCFIMQHGFNCAYLSLEEGPSQKNDDLIKKLKIKGLFTLYTSVSVEQLDILCKEGNEHGRFDAIFIDSWQRLIIDSKISVQKLRTVYPKIIFVVISQITKNGDMRGSNELNHDASMTLIIQKDQEGQRSVEVFKSRNGKDGEIYKLKNS